MNKSLKKVLLLFPPLKAYYEKRLLQKALIKMTRNWEEAVTRNREIETELTKNWEEAIMYWEEALLWKKELEVELTEYLKEEIARNMELEKELASLHRNNQEIMKESRFLKGQILSRKLGGTKNSCERIGDLTASIEATEQKAYESLKISGKWDFRGKINEFIISLDDNMKINRNDFVEKLVVFKRNFENNATLQKLLLLKVLNLMLAKYEMTNGYIELLSKPFSLTLDPSNSCVLKCPGCVHCNEIKQNIDWVEPFNMGLETFDKFIGIYGPFATDITGYNFGEPFINPLTPRIIEKARQYMSPINISSSLSVEIDAEAIVNSGLDWLTVSIDGATAETYNVYRRNGNFGLVMENLRKINNAKKTLGRNNPVINWQFLIFKHNVHEVDDAFELANESGCDVICISTPYSVKWFDKSIEVAASEKVGFHWLKSKKAYYDNFNDMENLLANDIIEGAYESFLEGPVPNEEPKIANRKPCGWLYQNITIDALGRVMPCCTIPNKGSTTLIFDTLNTNSYNSEKYLQARKFFIENKEFNTTQCEICEDSMSSFNHNLGKIMTSMNLVKFYRCLDNKVKQILTKW